MKQKLFDHLKTFGQEHLLTFWNDLNQADQQVLADQINSIDFAQVAELYERRNEPPESLTLADRANDPPAYKFSTVTDPTPCKTSKPITASEAVEAGTELLRNGKVGFTLVAGGQGTRLGFPHPKGMYPIGPLTGATLFQFHFEKVLAITRRYGHRVPYCVMTSPATHTETVTFLKDNDYFGLSPDDVFIFCQGTMPAVAMDDGKVLLDSKASIALSPDGHGGMLAALTETQSKDGGSVLYQIQQRGIEYLFYNQVDNPLVRIGSPEFLGYHLLSGSELTSQVIRKRSPTDKVGNIVDVDGRLYVIEYSDLPESVGQQKNPDGSLKIWAGSIAVHIFNVGLLELTSRQASSLPFHYARKKVPFVNLQSGERVKPEKENALKFERFIFDLLPSAKNAVVVEVDPPNHYAPLKNAPGSPSDSPETVKRDISAMHTAWLEQAGVVVQKDTPIEISPLYADSPEAVIERVSDNHIPPAPKEKTMTRNDAWNLLIQYNDDPFHLYHAQVMEGVMKYFAQKEGFGDEAEFWGIVGLLHDLDFGKFPEEHCIKQQAIMKEHGVDPRIIRATASHGWGCTGVEFAPEHRMEKILFAADELTGLIGAAALMRPSKSVQDMEVKSVKNKFKSPSFAAGCSREVIQKGAEMLGWTLEELIAQTLEAMKNVDVVK